MRFSESSSRPHLRQIVALLEVSGEASQEARELKHVTSFKDF